MGILETVLGGGSKIARNGAAIIDERGAIEAALKAAGRSGAPQRTISGADALARMGRKSPMPSSWDLFKNAKGIPGIGFGAAIGGGTALAGSMMYGGARFASPNNATVEDPVKNILRGGVIGASASALMLASHNMRAGSNFVKAAKASDSKWMSWASKQAPTVQNALNNKVTKAAIFAGVVAGSGNLDFTKPVNPVF